MGCSGAVSRRGRRLLSGASRSVVECEVVPCSLFVESHAIQQCGDCIKLVGCPGCFAELFAEPVLLEDPGRGSEVSLLLKVIEDSGGGGEVIWVMGKLNAGRRKHRTLLVLGRKHAKVALD